MDELNKQPKKEILPKKLRLRKPFFVLLAVFVLLVIGFGGWLYYIELPKYSFRFNANFSKKIAYPQFDQSLELNLKRTFSGAEYRDIRTYLSLASAENKDLSAKYNYLIRAYQKMAIAYNNSKKEEFKKALIALKNHISVYPQYNKNALL